VTVASSSSRKPGEALPPLIERIYELGEWRWQELELGTYEEVVEAAGWIDTLLEVDPSQAWLLEWYLVRADLWYLVRYVSSQGKWLEDGTAGVVNEEWIYDRCREVEADCNKVVDVWSRFHWKSYIKTVNKEIQEALREPDVTMLTLSHTRPIAKQFLAGIKREILGNQRLQSLSYHPPLDGKYPGGQIFPEHERGLIQCSLDAGIIVPRTGNPKEATFSAFGLVDSLPTSGHWVVRNLDDAVTKDSVTTPEQIEKVKNAHELSIPLGMPAGRNDEWVEGTYYHLQDLYHTMVGEKGYKLRLHPCYPVDWETTEKDKAGGITRLKLFFDMAPVVYEKDKIAEFETSMGRKEGSKNVAMQLYCDPNAGAGGRKFEREWLTYYDPEKQTPAELMGDGNCIMLCDSAGQKRSGSDYTAIWTLSLKSDGCAYVVDMARDRMSLTERGDQILRMHHRCRHTFYECRYERYGLMGDIEFLKYLLKQKKRRMKIVRVGGLSDKDERIERLIPWFEDGRIILPRKFIYKLSDGGRVDLVEQFKHDEYLAFPSSSFKDMLDGLSRLCDTEGNMVGTTGIEGKKIPLRLRFPGLEGEPEPKRVRQYVRKKKGGRANIPRSQRWLIA
jgi:phage terminase large subunit-like protein